MKISDKILSAWIDEGLSAEKMKAVRAAVQADPALQARAEALRAVGHQLRDETLASPVSAERMAADVRRAIRLSDTAQPSRVPLWGWVGAASCACLLVVAVLIPALGPAPVTLAEAEIEYVDSELPGVSPMVYTDHESGWTIVWLDNAELEPGI